MNDHVIIQLQGPEVDALLKINKQKYQDIVVKEKDKQVLYVKHLKALLRSNTVGRNVPYAQAI